MEKINRLLALFILLTTVAKAQVKDISFTLAPAGEYTWWDAQSGLKDGGLIGGKLGFAFGEYIALQGVYLQSINLKTNFEDFGLANYDSALFTAQDAEVIRWGGEFKANIGAKKLKPYLTLGAGIQSIDTDTSEKLEQIYASAGLGVKLNLTPRAVFAIEGKNTTYNFNAGQNLLTPADKTAFGVTDADFSSERLSNWSIQGSLEFYLGGRKPSTLSDLDQAYLDKFKGGFKGLQLVVEPSIGYMAFDNNSLLRDTYMLGGYVGLDFNEYVGVRLFYMHATQNEEVSLNFDKLAMYGLEFRANLNDGNGVTPYLMLSGGYMAPSSNYLGENALEVESSEFAAAGLGLTIPLGKHVEIIGGIRGVVTSGKDAQDITGPEDIQTHIMYNAGLKFALGKSSEATETVYNRNVTNALDAQQAVNDQKIQELKRGYEEKLHALDQELKTAYEAKDVDKAVELLEEKKETEEALEEVEKVEETQVVVAPQTAVAKSTAPVSTPTTQPRTDLIQMTPAEFESLIDRILTGLEDTPECGVQSKEIPTVPVQPQNQQQQIDFLNQRIDLLEKLLLEVNSRKAIDAGAYNQSLESQEHKTLTSDMSDKILDKLDDLNSKIDQNTDRINTANNNPPTVIVTPDTSNDKTVVTTLDNKGKVVSNEQVANNPSPLEYKYTSALLGFNYGGASTANFGLRGHYDIHKTRLQFMPEVYVGIGEATSFGVSGNLIYPFSVKKDDKVLPYIGAGLGFANIADNFHGNYNLILGAQLPFLHKNVYVDFTMRNSFTYNQIAIGYRLPF